VPVVVSFGNTIFPVNPQSLTRTYQRALSRKNILGGHNATSIGRQKLESRHVSLTRLSLEGILTGDNAKSVMDALETKFYARQPLNLITPTHFTGESALLTSLTFEVEKLKFYEKLIKFSAEFIIIPTGGVIRRPVWKVLVKSISGAWIDVSDVIEVEYERQWGAQAGSFQFTADNSEGQYDYDIFDYGRDVKIWLGYDSLTPNPQFWGLIDTLEYDISKQAGSSVIVAGRDYAQRLLEGTNFYQEFATLTLPDAMIATLLNGTPSRGIKGTGVQLYGLGQPQWGYWNSDAHTWGYTETFSGATRLEAINKINNYYKMQSYIDSGEHTGSPALVWFSKPRMTGLKQNASAGSNVIYVDDPQLYANSDWYSTEVNRIWISDVDHYPSSETFYVTSVDIASGALYLSGSLSNNYTVVKSAYITTDGSAFYPTPYIYTWGTDISSFNVKINGVGMRNRVICMNGLLGVYAIADSETTTIFDILAQDLGPNPGYNPGLQTKYGTKTEFLNDGAIQDSLIAKVAAYTELLKAELPDREVTLTVPGNPSHFPGAYLSFTFNGSRYGTGYILTNVREILSISGGYMADLVCRRTVQTMSPDLLMGAIKQASKNTVGQDTIKDAKGTSASAGTVESVTP
jgi:hypothetical protein